MNSGAKITAEPLDLVKVGQVRVSQGSIDLFIETIRADVRQIVRADHGRRRTWNFKIITATYVRAP